MKHLKINLSLLLCIATGSLYAQQSVTLDKAIASALANNRNIQIAVNRVESAENQATMGQAGLLPNVSATAAISMGENDTKIEIATQPDPVETNNARSITKQASINMDYTVFSGLANQRTYQKLKVTAALADANTRLEVENIILQVASAFYNVIRSQQNIDALTDSFKNSEERLERAKAKRELSGGTKLNELNAVVDFNKDKVALMNAEKALKDAIDNFNLVATGDLDNAWVPVGNIDAFGKWNLETLSNQMLEQNAQLLGARLNEQASLLDFKIAQSAYLPQLKLNSSYAFNRNEAEGNLLTSNQSLGYNAGLTLSIPIYQGGKRNIRTKNAKIQFASNELQAEETEMTLLKDLRAAYREYMNNLAIVALEKSNTETAQLNFDYSKQKFEQGLITGLQFREAQVNMLLANNNLNNVRYNAKLAELELMRLTGQLITQ